MEVVAKKVPYPLAVVLFAAGAILMLGEMVFAVQFAESPTIREFLMSVGCAVSLGTIYRWGIKMAKVERASTQFGMGLMAIPICLAGLMMILMLLGTIIVVLLREIPF